MQTLFNLPRQEWFQVRKINKELKELVRGLVSHPPHKVPFGYAPTVLHNKKLWNGDRVRIEINSGFFYSRGESSSFGYGRCLTYNLYSGDMEAIPFQDGLTEVPVGTAIVKIVDEYRYMDSSVSLIIEDLSNNHDDLSTLSVARDLLLGGEVERAKPLVQEVLPKGFELFEALVQCEKRYLRNNAKEGILWDSNS